MCLNHVGQLTRTNWLSTRTGGEHHIATGHGPMVQGILLTHHPGGVHGGGEGPGGDPPLRQGAGKSSPGAPDLGSAAAEKQRCDRGKGLSSRGFETCFKYTPKGGVGRPQGGPGAPPARPKGGAPPRGPGPSRPPPRRRFGF